MRAWFRRYRTALVIATSVVLVAAFAALVWRGAPSLDASRLKRLTPVQQETAIDAIRGRLLQLGAGLVVSIGLVYTALNFRLSRESHVTDRYTKAIEQLGSDGLDVRLGAIYALERIMIDSPRDHPTIVEVLAAFVREHSRLFMEREREPADTEPEGRRRPATYKSTTDVLAAATVLGWRPRRREECGRLDLTGAYLVQMTLVDANLTRADLTGANLTKADLTGADLTGADLTGVTLRDATLRDATLARSAGEWWRQLLDGADYRLSQVLEDTEPLPLGPLAGGQAGLFDDAVTAFADKIGVARPQARLMLNDPDAVVLVVHAAALLAVLDHASAGSGSRRVYSAADVLTGLLGHEARYWHKSAQARGLILDPAWNGWLSPSPA